MVVRVVGIGQRAGGDDGAGPAVIDRLREEGVGEGIVLCEVAEPSALLPLLEGAERVIVVDAALAVGAPGEVLVLRPEDVDSNACTSISTHGLSVGQAIALARVLSPDVVCPDIRIVAIAAERPAGIILGLSENVRAAIPRAADVVRDLASAPR